MDNQKIFEPLPKLELDKKRFRVKFCPCGKTNKDGKFVPYAGHENKGYCHSCGETFLPELLKVEQWNTAQPKAHNASHRKPVVVRQKPVSFIAVEVFKGSLRAHDANHFVKFLIGVFGVEVAHEVVKRYFIGTSKHWNGATVFWQIDARGKIRTGKIMLYSPTTGKRVKVPFNHIYWVHTALKQQDFELRQCLFGEHLLGLPENKQKPVAIVESEKTAIIGSVYLPQFIWVAVGSLTNLNAERCGVLQGRNVTLFPDLNGFDKWSSKAKELSPLANFTVSDLLERKATEQERKDGLDIADYFIKFDYKELVIQKLAVVEPPPIVRQLVEACPVHQSEYIESTFDWNKIQSADFCSHVPF